MALYLYIYIYIYIYIYNTLYIKPMEIFNDIDNNYNCVYYEHIFINV